MLYRKCGPTAVKLQSLTKFPQRLVHSQFFFCTTPCDIMANYHPKLHKYLSIKVNIVMDWLGAVGHYNGQVTPVLSHLTLKRYLLIISYLIICDNHMLHSPHSCYEKLSLLIWHWLHPFAPYTQANFFHLANSALSPWLTSVEEAISPNKVYFQG